MYIDTHCHLNFKDYDDDRAMVIGNAKKAGVKKFINPGVDLFFSQTAIALADLHPGVIFAGVGYHPYEAQKNPDVADLDRLVKENRTRIAAIGEGGLGYQIFK